MDRRPYALVTRSRVEGHLAGTSESNICKTFSLSVMTLQTPGSPGIGKDLSVTQYSRQTKSWPEAVRNLPLDKRLIVY